MPCHYSLRCKPTARCLSFASYFASWTLPLKTYPPVPDDCRMKPRPEPGVAAKSARSARLSHDDPGALPVRLRRRGCSAPGGGGAKLSTKVGADTAEWNDG
jgi:hypothetical protein